MMRLWSLGAMSRRTFPDLDENDEMSRLSVETADLFPVRLRGRQISLAVRWCVPVLSKRDRDETGNSWTSGCMIHNVYSQQFNLTTSEVFEVELRNVPLFVAVMGHAWSLKSHL